MALRYYSKIVNSNSIKDFYGESNFVGYILPNGMILSCDEGHNISDIECFFKLYLYFLTKDDDSRNVLLDGDNSDFTRAMILNFFRNTSKEKLIALSKFIKDSNLRISDILVQLFNYNLVTRLNKTILTTNNSDEYFYNYILMGFRIIRVPRICYDSKSGNYCFCNISESFENNEVNEEIHMIKKKIPSDKLFMFFR